MGPDINDNFSAILGIKSGLNETFNGHAYGEDAFGLIVEDYKASEIGGPAQAHAAKTGFGRTR